MTAKSGENLRKVKVIPTKLQYLHGAAIRTVLLAYVFSFSTFSQSKILGAKIESPGDLIK